ncbi:MAG: PD-(D/E)XK nuclease family protein [Candidatus Promineifilaceae bacterium]|nr:PD-(D/E)XK nuclease family protein [Candidatus Promineifilaceae bacterium]
MARSPLSLTPSRLSDLEACRRRFQLRYLERLAWPAQPEDEAAVQRMELGARFHRLMQRYHLGLSLVFEGGSRAPAEPELARWWAAFRELGPDTLPGRRLPEVSLTVPLAGHLLSGRFDLLVFSPPDAPPTLHIIDWKTTARPASEAALREAMQTRHYLLLAAEGAGALGRPVTPEQIRLTYWFAVRPEASVTFHYDSDWHAANRAYLTELVGELNERLNQRVGEDSVWPLTSDRQQCRRCAYQVVCGREMADLDLTDWSGPEEQANLEPSLP